MKKEFVGDGHSGRRFKSIIRRNFLKTRKGYAGGVIGAVEGELFGVDTVKQRFATRRNSPVNRRWCRPSFPLF